MQQLWRSLLLLLGVAIVSLSLAACGGARVDVSPGSSVQGNSATVGANPSVKTTTTSEKSTISFTANGGVNGSYTIESALTASKLRHGHKEFTIDLAQGEKSIFIAFYGYEGPGTYTLTNGVNGGDIRIDLGKNVGTWDLALEHASSCTLVVTSDQPGQLTGINRMQGRFSCQLLPAYTAHHPQDALKVTDGRFDVLIIVES
ncbi:hypothetical protein EPA93_39815 [Ktedonosporobacter rubrisoli]|uniref:Uncharacterized protein n=1 Tax=Ktedonosporobacter rubrisoli TaxID=2509675 RepID=A0A4P6K2T4_KTERU|nr:hypothetical protein [Ktedonosporobacter rubrisoli]QBD81796.1 hypothetical protein EPA93_39815 [Ktedonosporobacter rubrisoli]